MKFETSNHISEAPPLGLIPKNIHDTIVAEKRLKEVSDAIQRYLTAGLTINKDWIEEYNALHKQLSSK